jgi:hypothetical protein
MTQPSSMLCAQPSAAHHGGRESHERIRRSARRDSPQIPTAMTVRTSQPSGGPNTAGLCCTSHGSWGILFDHLLVEYPTVPRHRVLSLLSQANFSMLAYGLDTSTTLEMAETVTRYNLDDGKTSRAQNRFEP